MTAHALEQILTSGAGAGLAALEQMLGTPNLRLGPPQIAEGPLLQSGWVVSVSVLVQNQMRGFWALALEEATARWVVGRMLQHTFSGWDALSQSALLELGNVGACAFWGGVARRASGVFVPGVPNAQQGVLSVGLQALGQQLQAPSAVWAPCHAEAGSWQGTLWLILEQPMVQSLAAQTY